MENNLLSLNNFFDKIYLLTIKRNANRLRLVETNLEGVNYSVFFGADGKELDLAAMESANQYNGSLMAKNTAAQLKKYLGVDVYETPLPNMVACSLSHKMIYEDIIKNNYKTALILEDDAMIMRESINQWPAMMAQLPKDWELLYLGYRWKYDKSRVGEIKRKFIHPVLKNLKLKKFDYNFTNGFARKYSKNILHAGTHAGTHAYAITNKCAEFMLAYQTPIQHNPDLAFWELSMEQKIKSYSVTPLLFDTADAYSSIMEEYNVVY